MNLTEVLEKTNTFAATFCSHLSFPVREEQYFIRLAFSNVYTWFHDLNLLCIFLLQKKKRYERVNG